MKFYQVVILIIFFLYSCKENGVNLNKHNDILISSISYSINPSNTNNMFDSLGHYHNIGLNYIISNKSGFTCDSNIYKMELRSLIDTFLVNNQMNSSLYLDMSLPDSLYENFWDYTRFYNFDNMMTYYSINPNIKTGALIIINYVKLLEESYTVSDIIDSIKSYEMNVVNSNLSNADREQILKSASVARYSLVYWYDILNQETHDWLGFLSCESAKIVANKDNTSHFEGYSDTQKLIGVVASDITGIAITGGNIGAGVFYSAVSASVAWWDDIIDALTTFWDWLF